MKHGQFELLDGLRIIRIQHDPLAHHVSSKDANAVLAFSANWLPVLEELLSQLVHLKQWVICERRGQSEAKRIRKDVNKVEDGKRGKRNQFSSVQSVSMCEIVNSTFSMMERRLQITRNNPPRGRMSSPTNPDVSGLMFS